MVCMTDTKTVNRFAGLLMLGGCTVERDDDAGTLKATDENGVVVYQAIQKGPGQPWIVLARDTERFKFTNGGA